MAPAQQKPSQQPQNTAVTKPDAPRPPAISPVRIPYHPIAQKEFGITYPMWHVLVDSVFPAAQTIEGVLLALGYCKANDLDVFSKCVHIVPIWSKEKNRYVETVWPGIQLLRIKAHRTGQYVGKDEVECGPLITRTYQTKYNGEVTIEVPEWMRQTVYRRVGGERCAFVGPKVYWDETYTKAGRDASEPNDMWLKRPHGQMEKCTEAASLRAGFPEAIGDFIPEEIERSNARPAATFETHAIGSSQFNQMQGLTDDRAAQEERDAVLQATANMTAHDEPEPEFVPARQKQEPQQQQRSQPAGAGSVPPQQLDQLEIWLVERYQSHDALMADHDTILEAYDAQQMTAVAKLIKKRLSALEKKAD